jgi:hypothetical protein
MRVSWTRVRHGVRRGVTRPGAVRARAKRRRRSRRRLCSRDRFPLDWGGGRLFLAFLTPACSAAMAGLRHSEAEGVAGCPRPPPLICWGTGCEREVR